MLDNFIAYEEDTSGYRNVIPQKNFMEENVSNEELFEKTETKKT